MTPAIELESVSHRYGAVEALSCVDLRVAEGERVAVVGPSGSGKSTLMAILCGLIVPSAGRVSGAPATLMPQRDLLLPWLSALDNAALALRIGGLSRAQARRAARPELERLGLGEFATVSPDRLSGGMRQRVSLVRALLAPRATLALDEPFAALDAITRSELHRWLTEVLGGEPRTCVLVTHDVEEAVVLSDRVVVLSPRPGQIVGELAVELAYPRAASDPAVQALRAAVLGRLVESR